MTTWTELAKQHDLKYFLIAFVDLFGGMRAKLVPATAMDGVAKSGAGFAGFAAWFDMTPADPDVLVMPDMDTLTLLPWKPGVAWVTGDLYMGGKPVAQNPRQVLKGLIAKAAEQGVELKTGVECEYFLISPDGTAISDPADQQAKPCYDQQALMRRYEIVAEICDAMISLGWKPYQNDHEDANGQFEMNWEFDTALKTADRHAFFKFMVKSIAEKHGYKATFMPKPFANLTGNGCHVHASLWSTKDGSNVFEDEAASWVCRRRPITSSAASFIRPKRFAPSPIPR
jgi:glutamine synthetase